MLLLAMTALPPRVQAQASAPIAEDSKMPRLTKPPKLVTFVAAEYPESEKAKGRTASVVLQIGISPTGTVTEASILESAGPAFDDAALAAVRRFIFEPAEIDGRPAAIRINYRYQFVLEAALPTTAILQGTVRALGSGDALSGVKIALDDGREVVTGADGGFTIEDVSPGRHRLLLSREDLKPLQTEEEFTAGQKLEAVYEIELPSSEPLPGEERDDLEIVITAPKLTKQTVSTRIEADQARRVAGTQGDVLKIVESMPGVARASAGSSQIVVWGASPEDTRVYVDGVRVPLLYHFGGLRSVVHTDLVRSVELVPGGYGAAYGRGLGGLVAVESADPASDRLHASAQLDPLDASLAVQGPLSENWQVAAAARRSHLDWLLARVTDEDVGEFFPIPKYSDGQARVRRKLGEESFVELSGLLSSDRVSRTVDSVDPADRKQETRSQRFQRLSLRYRGTQADGARIDILPWFGRDQRELQTSFGGVPTALELDSTLFGLRASWNGQATKAIGVTLGIDIEGSLSTGRRSGSISSPSREGDARAFGQPPSDQLNSDDWESVTGSAAPFVELDVALDGGRLHLVPGLRLDPLFVSVSRRVPKEGNSPGVGASSAEIELEPRLSARYALSPRVTFKAAYGEYRQPPLAEDLSPVFGNPLLGSSSARHLLAGGAFQLTQALGLETTVFYTKSEGLAARNPIPSPLIAEALVGIGEGRSYGAQFLVRQNSSNGFFGWVAYTLLRSERLDGPGERYRLFDYDQTHVLTALASYDLGRGFDLGARVRYATGYPRTPVVDAYYDARRDLYEPVLGAKNSERIPDFVELDLRLAKRWSLGTSELETYLDVQNVTNRDNPEEIAYSPDYSERRYVSGLPILPLLGARWSY
jgi:TonB family protein